MFKLWRVGVTSVFGRETSMPIKEKETLPSRKVNTTLVTRRRLVGDGGL